LRIPGGNIWNWPPFLLGRSLAATWISDRFSPRGPIGRNQLPEGPRRGFWWTRADCWLYRQRKISDQRSREHESSWKAFLALELRSSTSVDWKKQVCGVGLRHWLPKGHYAQYWIAAALAQTPVGGGSRRLETN